MKATSLGTDDIPFSFTSGNILKRASSIAYMLEIAPPRGDTDRIDVGPPAKTKGNSFVCFFSIKLKLNHYVMIKFKQLLV